MGPELNCDMTREERERDIVKDCSTSGASIPSVKTKS